MQTNGYYNFHIVLSMLHDWGQGEQKGEQYFSTSNAQY